MKIRCYCDLYVSSGLQKKKNKVLKKLMEQVWQPSLYLITFAQGRQNHLEFFLALLLKQPEYEKKTVFVVGIADGYDAAMYLVEEIVQEVVVQSGGTDIRGFLEMRQKSFEERRS